MRPRYPSKIITSLLRRPTSPSHSLPPPARARLAGRVFGVYVIYSDYCNGIRREGGEIVIDMPIVSSNYIVWLLESEITYECRIEDSSSRFPILRVVNGEIFGAKYGFSLDLRTTSANV